MKHAKKIEVVLTGAALAVTLGTPLVSYAATGTGCNAGNASQITGAATNFVKDNFTPKCSVGVTVVYNDLGAAFTVKAANTSGMHTFGGTSDGGAVIQCESSSVASPTSGLSAGSTNGCS